MSTLTKEEKNKRIAEVNRKGVYFHTALLSDQPIKREDADELIERNMDAVIGAKSSVRSTEETISFFRELLEK